MPNDILLIAEHRGGKIKKVTIEGIGAAQKLAFEFGGKANVAILGSGIDSLASELAEYGLPVYLFDDPKLKDYSYDAYSQALVPFIKSRDYAVILMGASPTGRDLSATLGARLQAGVATDCTELKTGNDMLIAVRPIFAGKVIGYERVDTKPAIATIRPNVFPAATAKPPAERSRKSPRQSAI